MSTFDPDALEYLTAIIEEGGFERAALACTRGAGRHRVDRAQPPTQSHGSREIAAQTHQANAPVASRCRE